MVPTVDKLKQEYNGYNEEDLWGVMNTNLQYLAIIHPKILKHKASKKEEEDYELFRNRVVAAKEILFTGKDTDHGSPSPTEHYANAIKIFNKCFSMLQDLSGTLQPYEWGVLLPIAKDLQELTIFKIIHDDKHKSVWTSKKKQIANFIARLRLK